MSTKTYLEALDECARLYPDRPLFWIPQNSEPGKPVSEWSPLTFAQFYADVCAAKEFYAKNLSHLDKGSVIGLWLLGNAPHVVQTFGVAAAGFIPQLFSLYYSHAPVVFELLIKSGAKALMIDSQTPGMPYIFEPPVELIDLSGITFPTTSARLELPPLAEVKDNIAFILHSSGSTARIPTLIPLTHLRITAAHPKYPILFGQTDRGNEVLSQIGNFNHAAGLGEIINCLYGATSIIIPSSLTFTTDELLNMIQFCGLTRLIQLTALLAPTLRKAQTDPQLLCVLRSLRSLQCAGIPFPADLDTWCHSVGLVVINLYGNTECSGLMVSTPSGRPSLFKPISTVLYKWVPQEQSEASLRELVILPGSKELPHSSLLAADGNFYTGDLFEPAGDGYYRFKGRKNDWIKTGSGHFCDTKSIEDAVKELCKEVLDCVAVGSGRRSPALLVETVEDKDSVPQIIVERLEGFNKSRFPHERLDNPGLIIVVDHGILPRTVTKGNIRRKAAEELFADELNLRYKVTEP